MAQLAPFSRVDLRQALVRLFNDEELRTLCFDLGAKYDYDSLRGEGKRAKTSELVVLAELKGHLAALETAIRGMRPAFDTLYSYCRSYIFELGRLAGSARSVQRHQEKILYEVKVERRPCRRCLQKLEQLARNIQFIGELYDPASGRGPPFSSTSNRFIIGVDVTRRWATSARTTMSNSIAARTVLNSLSTKLGEGHSYAARSQ